MNFVVLDTRFSGIYLKLSELRDLARTKRVTELDTFFVNFIQSAFRDGPDLVGVRQSSLTLRKGKIVARRLADTITV